MKDSFDTLVAKAQLLNDAWQFATAMSEGITTLPDVARQVHDYRKLNSKTLRRHVDDLTRLFKGVAEPMLVEWDKTDLLTKVKWFAGHCYAMQKAPFGAYAMGRVQDAEATLGKLVFRERMDTPPYAEMLIQGGGPIALRHPEYHLGTDLALLFNLLLDSVNVMDDAEVRRERHSSEHTQSLARSVILTCFNLLESFISGLAVAWLADHPNAPPDTQKKLADDNAKLRRKLVDFPALMTGSPWLADENAPPFGTLMGVCKHRRDSFVHCKPGPAVTKFGGYVKEHQFHDADLVAAETTVTLTCEVISLIWKHVHGRPGPQWLPKRGLDGRFPRVSVALRSTQSSK